MKLFTAAALLPLGYARGSLLHSPMQYVRELGQQLYKPFEGTELSTLYPERNFSVPVDHFHNDSKYEPHSDSMFNLRYWFDDTYYHPGGPVFLLAGGETDAAGRLPFLQKGVIYLLSKATGGLGVVLEHRYYGTSFPVPDLSVENLRFLTTDQALADTAYFATNVVFDRHGHENLTAGSVPWIAYGGSYAGAFVAFLRVIYPNVFWGAISSSGVTKAIWSYPQYFEIIRDFGPKRCMQLTQSLIHVVDRILLDHKDMVPQLKRAFGLSNITHDNDFASALSLPLQYFQALNWDPAVNQNGFYSYCLNLTSQSLLWSEEAPHRGIAESFITTAGYGKQLELLALPLLNFFGFTKYFVAQSCASTGRSSDECYGTHDPSPYQNTNLSNYGIRSWPWQFCTEWGYLQTAKVSSGYPIISRLIDLEYSSLICRLAFNLTEPADVSIVNRHGGFDIAYERLAIVDGRCDPWRPATPHAPEAWPWRRNNTIRQPFFVIADGVHHWDQNGVFPNETFATFPPGPVASAHEEEVNFVTAWVMQAKDKFPMTSKRVYPDEQVFAHNEDL